jgi:hypothetical protein
MNDAANHEQTPLARALLDANHYVGSLLRVRDNSIANASNLCALLSTCGDQLNLTNLRVLSFLRDMIIPREGSVCCSVIRSLAREELRRRGAWRMKDRLHAIIFGCWYSNAESLTSWRSGGGRPHRVP